MLGKKIFTSLSLPILWNILVTYKTHYKKINTCTKHCPFHKYIDFCCIPKSRILKVYFFDFLNSENRNSWSLLFIVWHGIYPSFLFSSFFHDNKPGFWKSLFPLFVTYHSCFPVYSCPYFVWCAYNWHATSVTSVVHFWLGSFAWKSLFMMFFAVLFISFRNELYFFLPILQRRSISFIRFNAVLWFRQTPRFLSSIVTLR